MGTVWGLRGDCRGTVQAQGKAEGHARCAPDGPNAARDAKRARSCRVAVRSAESLAAWRAARLAAWLAARLAASSAARLVAWLAASRAASDKEAGATRDMRPATATRARDPRS